MNFESKDPHFTCQSLCGAIFEPCEIYKTVGLRKKRPKIKTKTMLKVSLDTDGEEFQKVSLLNLLGGKNPLLSVRFQTCCYQTCL